MVAATWCSSRNLWEDQSHRTVLAAGQKDLPLFPLVFVAMILQVRDHKATFVRSYTWEALQGILTDAVMQVFILPMESRQLVGFE